MSEPQPPEPTPATGFDPTVRATPSNNPTARASKPAIPDEVSAAGPDARFDKFVRTKKLGAGGMGEVWKAWDSVLHRWVALKFLKGGPSFASTDGRGDDDEILRFTREAQVAGKLAHANIAAIYEVGQAQGRHYIAMQFVDGTTLKGVPRGDARRLVTLLRDAARAVAYAHGEGIVHRDLKPENVMVARNQVFVMDFGLARPVDGGSEVSLSGAVVGTPSFMSPEQARGERIDARADVWSLGATLYDLLAGRPPFRGANVYETLTLVQEEDPVPPRRIDARIDRDLETIVLKCLDKEPSRRYATADELADDLTRWLEGDAILAHPASAAYRWRKFVSRRKAVVIPTVAAVVLAAGVAVWLAASAISRSARIREGLAAAATLERDGRLPEARDRYRQVLDLDPGNATGVLGFDRLDAELRRRSAELEKTAASVKARDAALKIVEAARPALDRALLYLYNKDAAYDELVRRVDMATKLLEEAIAQDPTLVPSHYLLGTAWELKGWDDRAEACWRKAIELDGRFGPARFCLGRLLVRRAYQMRMGTSEADRLARRPRAEKLAQEAEREIQAAVEAGTGFDDEVLREAALAMIGYCRNELDRAAEIAKTALRRFKDRDGLEELHWILGVVATDLDEEIAAYGRAIALRPRFAMALFCRAFAMSRRDENLDASIADYTSALLISPRLSAAWINRGSLRDRKGDRDGALADFREALRIAPNEALVHSNIGGNHRLRAERLEAQGRRDEAAEEWRLARESYDRAIDLDPDWAEAYVQRGIVKFSRGDAKGGLADCATAIRIAEIESAYAARGNMKVALQDLDGAIADYDQAIRLDGTNGRTYSNRGAVKVRKGDFEGAIADLSIAVQRQPELVDGWINRGIAYQSKGDIDRAVADYRKALQIAPADWPDRAAVEEEIRRIKP